MAAKTTYPTGVRPLLMDEAARRRRIEARFVDAFERAGFAEIVLPMIDYAEPYAALVGRAAARASYRFTDREGDLVGIRSDFTPMVARALAPELRDADLPLRVFYRGDVIRVEASRLGANRELFQIGAEIVGDASVDADVAMLRLAASLVEGATIAYTDVSIAQALVAHGDAVAEALQSKRMSAAIPQQVRGIVGALISGDATLDDVAPFAPAAAARLRGIGEALGDDGTFVLHLDESDVANGYYTGLRFRVFAGDGRARVAQGGRYDDLYARFGRAAAAIGFTFTIDDLD